MKYVVKGNEVVLHEPLDCKAILTCGQVFRFREVSGGYEVFSSDKRCLMFSDKIVSDEPMYFVNYFDLDADYGEYINSLSKFDELSYGLKVGKGIRILRQDLFEMIISFIISANNNIPRIKGIIERICDFCGIDKGGYRAFPTPDELKRVTKEELRSLGAGYRDISLVRAAKILSETDFLYKVTEANTNEATKMLLSLPGVGPKVADCILLFGLRRWDCFPVDTWIMKTCSNETLDTPSKVREYYLKRYGSLSGLAQQYIFYGAREK